MNTTWAINETKLIGLVLDRGGHQNPAEGLCFMEAVAYTHDLTHTDDPNYVSPLLGEVGRRLNDLLPDDSRQRLVPLIRVLPGTVDDGHDEARSYMALDWFVRVWLPTWLELSPECQVIAAKVRGLGPVVDFTSAAEAQPVVRAARVQAADAWDAAEATAENTVQDITWDAVAEDAAKTAVGDVAVVTARDVTKLAAKIIGRGVAAAAAGDVAKIVARAAARNAPKGAATDAAKVALSSTVTALQLSAIELYQRMALVGREGEKS